MISEIINIQLPKGSSVSPKDLIELDCDTRNFVKQEVMTDEELQNIVKLYENVKPINNGK